MVARFLLFGTFMLTFTKKRFQKMKISDKHFICDWCRHDIKKLVSNYVSPDKQSRGKQNLTSTLICPYCGNKVSQKTKLEITGKV